MKIAFIGHRKIRCCQELVKKLYSAIETLLELYSDIQFLFGSNSEFDALCLRTVTELKRRYPDIKRVYVRAEFQHINDEYHNYLKELYDETFFPSEIEKAGKTCYIARNKLMIDMCDKLFVYYDPTYTVFSPPGKSKNSGTRIAVEYALKKRKEIINFFIPTDSAVKFPDKI